MVVMMTGEPTADTAAQTLRLGAVDYLAEPVGKHEVTKTGLDILEQISFPWLIAEWVCQHHEWIDGSGYPRALKAGDRSCAIRHLPSPMRLGLPRRSAEGLA